MAPRCLGAAPSTPEIIPGNSQIFQQTLVLQMAKPLLSHYASPSVFAFTVSWKTKLFIYWRRGRQKKKKFSWKCHFPCGVFISKPSLILCVWIWNEALKWKPVFHFKTSAWAPFSIQRWGFIPMFKNIKIRFPRFILSTSIFHHLVSLTAASFLLLSPLLILFYSGKGTKLAKMW